MRHIKRLSVMTVAAALLLLGFVLPASAADYWSTVASSLGSSHVYVDPSASPTITASEQAALESLIASTGKPIYVALVSNDQTSGVSPADMPARLHSALGKSGVYAVSSGGGFYGQGFNVPSSIANQAGTLAKAAISGSMNANGGKPVFADVYQRYVKSIASIPTSSAQSNSTPNNAASSSSSSGIGVWGWLGIIVGVIVLIIGIVILVQAIRRHRKKDDLLENLGHDMAADSGYMRSNQGVFGYGGRPLDDYVTTTGTTTTAPPRARTKHVTGGQNIPRPGGGNVTINNYATAQQPGYQHRYGGGYYGGVYYPAGYYADPFWTWVAMDAMSDRSYDRGYEAGERNEDRDNDRSSNNDTGFSGGGSWNTPDTSNNDTGSSGGGSWFGNDTSSSSSYDSGSSGGSDWGSSSSDSGGGGGDWGS